MTKIHPLKRPLAKAIYEAQGSVCGLCYKAIPIGRRAPRPERVARDHVWPRAINPERYLNTLIVHCRCTQLKGDKTPTTEQLHMLRKVNLRVYGIDLAPQTVAEARTAWLLAWRRRKEGKLLPEELIP